MRHGLVAAVGGGALGLGEIAAQALLELGRRLAAQHEPLARSLQAVERAERRLAPAGRVRQLVLGLLALLEQGRELLLGAATRDHDGVAARFGVGPAVGHGEEVELGDPRPQRRDLDRELLGPLGGGRLQRERAQPLAHLLLDVLRALDLDPDPGELELGPVLAALELAEPGGLLDEVAPVLRLRGEHGVDLALRDDRVHRAAEADVGEQLDEIGAPHGGLVDEVLALAATNEPARDRDLAEVDLVAEAAVRVVEHELDLAVIRRRPVRGAAEEDVVGLLGPELGRGQRAGGPDDRVGDVRLAGAVRADDHGDARLELELDRVDERLEAADLDRLEVHVRRTLTTGADGAFDGQERAGVPEPRRPRREYSHEMISSPWFLLLVGAVGASVTMIGVWLVSIRIANASYVDVAWALGIAGTAVAYALLAEGSTLHRVLVAGLGTIWGVRLGTYLLARLAGKEEDGRYQELRRRWAPHVNRYVLRLLPGPGGVHPRLLAAVRLRGGRPGRDDVARVGGRRTRARRRSRAR